MPTHCFDARALLAIPAAIAALLISGSASAAAVNLLSNGSFEQNNFFVERSDFPRLDDLNGSVPTGWVRDSGDLAEYLTRSPTYQGVTIYNPAHGEYFIGAHDGEWWEQTFATVPGTQYQLTYSSAYGAVWQSSSSSYYRPGGSTPGTVTLTGTTTLFSGSLSGASAAPSGTTLLDSPFVWSEYTESFVADGNFATLRFAGPSVSFGGFVFVDNVSVTTVPVPGSIWLLMSGASTIWLARRRRKASLPS